MTLKVSVRPHQWPLRKPFRISQGVELHADVIICEISDGEFIGRGEAAGVSYNGETIESMQQDIINVTADISAGLTREELPKIMSAGGARNSVDCALWDLQAKQAGQTIWQLINWQPRPVTTVYTVGIEEPELMQKDAAQHSEYPILKVKVDMGDPLGQIRAIRTGAPDSAIIVDANQAWTVNDLERYAVQMKELGVKMIEQPVAMANDDTLRNYDGPLPLCADESCATSEDLDRLKGLYSMVNIKLDKTGGLTEALAMVAKAESMGFDLMIGNMLGSSLAMAPSFVIAQRCQIVDIDGPLLQAEDCGNAMQYENGHVGVFSPALWG